MSDDNNLPWPRRFLRDWPILLLIATIAVIYLLTIRHGHDWSGDFALHIVHAKNLLNGVPYSLTGYIYNPNYPSLSPPSYPPVLSLMLAPVYALFGLNLEALKGVIIASFTIFLAAYYWYGLHHLDLPVSRYGIIVVIASNLWFWENKDLILSYFPFLMFAFLALVLMDQLYRKDIDPRRGIGLAVALGLCLYLAYGTRSVGVVLAATLVLTDLFHQRFRKISLAVVVALGVFLICYLAQNALLDTDKSYLASMGRLMSSPRSGTAVGAPTAGPAIYLESIYGNVVQNSSRYVYVLWKYWDNGVVKLGQGLLFLLTGILAMVGFYAQVRKRIGAGEIFLVLYVGLLLVVPFYVDQYFLPIIPLYLLYVFRGAETVGSARPFEPQIFVFGLLMLILVSFVGTYSTQTFADFPEGVEKRESVELFEFLRQKTPADSVIVFRRPRVAALYTGRRSLVYHKTERPDQLWDFFREVGATHLVVAKDDSIFQHVGGATVVTAPPQSSFMLAWIEHYRYRFTKVFENDDFVVYQWKVRKQAGSATAP
jgi:hypothetical protein